MQWRECLWRDDLALLQDLLQRRALRVVEVRVALRRRRREHGPRALAARAVAAVARAIAVGLWCEAAARRLERVAQR